MNINSILLNEWLQCNILTNEFVLNFWPKSLLQVIPSTLTKRCLRCKVKVAWILSYCCAYRKLVFVIFLLEKINNPFEVVTIILKLAKPNLNIPKLTAPNSPNLNLFIFVFPCLNEKQFSSLSSHPFLLSMTAYETPISSASPITLSTIFCAPPRVCFTLVHSYTLTHKKLCLTPTHLFFFPQTKLLWDDMK